MNFMPPTPSLRLSKSKIAAFEHCPLRLWLQLHKRHLGKIDRATEDRFQFGHDVGRLAQFRSPSGILVDTGQDMDAARDMTMALLAQGPIQPIFEATFQHEDVLVRVDILEPDGHGGWNAVEVKASTAVKPYQLADLATQVWVLRGCGIEPSKAIIRHIARPFFWERPDIAKVRLTDTDVTRRVSIKAARKLDIIAEARTAVRGPEIEREMGPHCENPFTCEFRAYCGQRVQRPLLAKMLA